MHHVDAPHMWTSSLAC